MRGRRASMKLTDFFRSVLFGVLMFVVLCPVGAAEPSADDMKAAAERKAKKTAALQATVDELDAARKEAGKKQRYAEAKRLGLELKDARSQLAEVQGTSVEDFAKKITAEREEAEEAARMVQQARAEAARKTAAELAEKKLADREEEERLRLSGGCPLDIIGLEFLHSRERLSRAFGMYGPCTLVKSHVVNRSGKEVEAYELLIRLVDGFDKVLIERTVQGKALRVGEKRPANHPFEYEGNAVTLKIFVQRAKFSDGEMWERKEGDLVGRMFKVPEGAEVVD
jgi:hypothetical protein